MNAKAALWRISFFYTLAAGMMSCYAPILDCAQDDKPVENVTCAQDGDKQAACDPETNRCEWRCAEDADCQAIGESTDSVCIAHFCRRCDGADAAGSCTCKANTDCNSQTCDEYASRNVGRCVPERTLAISNMNNTNTVSQIRPGVLFVNNRSSICSKEDSAPSGTKERPFCTINQALSRAIQPGEIQRIIKVAGSLQPYSLTAIDPDQLPSQVMLIGDPPQTPDSPLDAANESFTRLDSQINVLNGSKDFALSIEGFYLSGPTTGLHCINSTQKRSVLIQLLHSEIKDVTSDSVLTAKNCQVQIDRVVVRENAPPKSKSLLSVESDQGTDYRLAISNTAIINNTSKAAPIIQANGVRIDATYSMITQNNNSESFKPFSIKCDTNQSNSINQSIIANNSNYMPNVSNNLVTDNCAQDKNPSVIRQFGISSDPNRIKTYPRPECVTGSLLAFPPDMPPLSLARDVTCWDISGKKRPCNMNMSGNLLCPGASYPD